MKDNEIKLKSKLKNKGILGFFVGYPEYSGSSTFRIYKIKTKTVIISRDVIWLNKSYGDYYMIPKSEREILEEENDEEDTDC